MKARLTFLLVMGAVFCIGMTGLAGSADAKEKGAVQNMNTDIHIYRITGTIRIIAPGNKVLTVKRGELLPEIPLGSKIMVLSGRAQVEMAGIRTVIGEGQALILAKDESTGAIRLTAAEGSKGTIRVRAGSSVVLLAANNEITVTSNTATRKQEIKAVQGTITLVTPQGKQELAEGGKITSDLIVFQRPDQKSEPPVIPEPPQPKIEEASPSIPQ